MIRVRNITEAVNYFINTYCNGHGRLVTWYQGDRGPICGIVTCNRNPNNLYYVTLKNDWFYAFSKIYKRVTQKGIGQSFNLELMHHANNAPHQALLIAVMPDGTIYGVDAIAALDYVITNNTFRTPSTENHQEGSIPARMLVRFYPSLASEING